MEEKKVRFFMIFFPMLGIVANFYFLLLYIFGLYITAEVFPNLLKSYVDLGFIEVRVGVFYIIVYFVVFFIVLAILHFIGLLLDKILIKIFGYEIYLYIALVVALIASAFIIVSTTIIGFSEGSSFLSKIGLGFVGFIVGVIITYYIVPWYELFK